MNSPRNTKKEILGIAEELLQQRGFQGFSYHHIAAERGIRKAAVHYHFPSKVDLGVALIERYREGFRWWSERMREQHRDPLTALEQFLELESRYRRDGKVCPLGVVGVEFHMLAPELHESGRALLAEVVGWLEQVLAQGRASGVFRFKGGVRARALTLMAGLQGGLQLARLEGDEAFAQVLAQLRADLGISAVTHLGMRATG
jgi:TetR/AcrR family transcriptional repressor of nem operon